MPEPIDISSEDHRVYTYADGSTFRINAPQRLYVLSETSHRVVDAQGVTHRPSPGWIGLSWLPRPGQPAFVA